MGIGTRSSYWKLNGKGKSAGMNNEDILQLEAEATDKNEWKREITKKLHQKVARGSENLSIYKVPKNLRKVKDEAYNSRVVSIGPFHLGNHALVAMRHHKWHYMQYFFARIEDHQQSLQCLEVCTNAIYDLDEKVRGCYSEKIDHIDKNALAEIMLLDGCFILELFLRYDQHLNMKLEDESDPIFNSAWMIAALRHDLILLENQIPFLILKSLYDAMKSHLKGTPNSVTSLALKFFEMNQKSTKEEPDTKNHHLLHLLHKFYLPNLDSTTTDHQLKRSVTEIRPGHMSISVSMELTSHIQYVSAINLTSGIPRPEQAAATNIKTWGFNFSASNLLRAGIEFEKGLSEDHLLNITFVKGIIRIPPVDIHLTSDSLFRNLIAFEQCSLRSTHHITSYLILMKSLISSTRDIKLLRERGIINLLNHNSVGDQEYFTEFKTILDMVVVKDFCFGKLCDQVNAYCKSWLPLRKHKISTRVRFRRHINFLYRTYFSSPWSIISFVAAVALFVLTVIQTYYSIHSH
ncbi:unnamed protein product [Prunus armeniaca]|uniref:Uncharacterized protein n=1 Tax=Prunus armeniaca TaxID=36596 RepID=A0A6J5XVW2_PRUAR|nr:unnamed protein product [Prunus armeniaca]